MTQFTPSKIRNGPAPMLLPTSVAPAAGHALIQSADPTVAEWSPSAAALLPDILPIAGTLLSYGGSRQLAAGGAVSHSGSLSLGGNLLLPGNPSLALHAAPKQYVDSAVAGINLSPYLLTSVAASTYVALAGSYANPSWLASLPQSKITGLTVSDSPTFSAVNQSGTGAMTLPAGTTAQRPTGATSMVRWNTTTSRHEFWTGAAWDNHVRLSGDTMTGALSLGSNGLTCGAITASGVVQVPSGSASAPSLAVGGTTHGMYQVSATSLGLSVAGTQRAQLWNDGSLYLFGTTPWLQLGSTTPPILKRAAANTLGVYQSDGSTDGNLTCGAITASGATTLVNSLFLPSSTSFYYQAGGSGTKQIEINSGIGTVLRWSATSLTLDSSAATLNAPLGIQTSTDSVNAFRVRNAAGTEVTRTDTLNRTFIAGGDAFAVRSGTGGAYIFSGGFLAATNSSNASSATGDTFQSRAAAGVWRFGTTSTGADATIQCSTIATASGNLTLNPFAGGIVQSNQTCGFGSLLGGHISDASRGFVFSQYTANITNGWDAGVYREGPNAVRISATYGGTPGGLTCGAITASGTVRSQSFYEPGGATTGWYMYSNGLYGYVSGGQMLTMNSSLFKTEVPIQETPRQSSLAPTTTDIPTGKRQGWYNTTTSEFRDYVNVGGTLFKSAAYT